jgi:hypothetical protein
MDFPNLKALDNDGNFIVGCYLGAFGNAFTTVFSTLGALGPYRPSSARARVVLLLWFHVANSGDGGVVGRAQARARCTHSDSSCDNAARLARGA